MTKHTEATLSEPTPKLAKWYEKWMQEAHALRRLLMTDMPVGNLTVADRQKLITSLNHLSEQLVLQVVRSDPKTYAEWPDGTVGCASIIKRRS